MAPGRPTRKCASKLAITVTATPSVNDKTKKRSDMTARFARALAHKQQTPSHFSLPYDLMLVLLRNAAMGSRFDEFEPLMEALAIPVDLPIETRHEPGVARPLLAQVMRKKVTKPQANIVCSLVKKGASLDSFTADGLRVRTFIWLFFPSDFITHIQSRCAIEVIPDLSDRFSDGRTLSTYAIRLLAQRNHIYTTIIESHHTTISIDDLVYCARSAPYEFGKVFYKFMDDPNNDLPERLLDIGAKSFGPMVVHSCKDYRNFWVDFCGALQLADLTLDASHYHAIQKAICDYYWYLRNMKDHPWYRELIYASLQPPFNIHHKIKGESYASRMIGSTIEYPSQYNDWADYHLIDHSKIPPSKFEYEVSEKGGSLQHFVSQHAYGRPDAFPAHPEIVIAQRKFDDCDIRSMWLQTHPLDRYHLLTIHLKRVVVTLTCLWASESTFLSNLSVRSMNSLILYIALYQPYIDSVAFKRLMRQRVNIG
jgi:hypothetical protein